MASAGGASHSYQMVLMGVLPAVAVSIGVGLLNYYTLWLLVILYLERKRIMVSTMNGNMRVCSALVLTLCTLDEQVLHATCG